MNQLAASNQTDITPLNDQQLTNVLGDSLYTGAKPASVRMVIAYCRAAQLDPMQKPVHIVPMSVKNSQTGEYEYRDVIMPGVGLYRIQADRSGTYAGLSAPEYGPDITQGFTDKKGDKVNLTFPEWCEITARKMMGNILVDFTAREYWLENYATDSRNSSAPNAMWRKRPKGQLAKCTEAQALRKGWPEIGQAPTAEEMEGKIIGAGDADITEKPVNMPQAKTATLEKLEDNKPIEGELMPNNDSEKVKDNHIHMIKTKLDHAGIGENDYFRQFNITSHSNLAVSQLNNVMTWIGSNGA